MSIGPGTRMALRNAMASNAAMDDLLVVLNALGGLLDNVTVGVIDEVVTLTNAVETNLSTTVPAGSLIISTCSNNDTLVVGDASGDNLLAKVGIGVTADPDKYGISADLVLNTKVTRMNTPTYVATAEQLCVKAAKTDGSAATEKFVAGGLVHVRVVYLAPIELADAS